MNGQVARRVLAILAEPSALYNPQGEALENPTVGLGILFKPPYVKHISFQQAYFYLSQWCLGHQTGIPEERMMFVNIDSSCDLGPYVEPTLYGSTTWINDYKMSLRNPFLSTGFEVSSCSRSPSYHQRTERKESPHTCTRLAVRGMTAFSVPAYLTSLLLTLSTRVFGTYAFLCLRQNTGPSRRMKCSSSICLN